MSDAEGCFVIYRQGQLEDNPQQIVYHAKFPALQKTLKRSVRVQVSVGVMSNERGFDLRYRSQSFFSWISVGEQYYPEIVRAILEYEGLSSSLCLAHENEVIQALGKFVREQ